MSDYNDFIEEQDLSWVYCIEDKYYFISCFEFYEDESIYFVPKGIEFWQCEEKVEYYKVEFNEKDLMESEIVELEESWLRDFCAETLKDIKQIKIENKLIEIEKDFAK
jgi:hypothetical protein